MELQFLKKGKNRLLIAFTKLFERETNFKKKKWKSDRRTLNNVKNISPKKIGIPKKVISNLKNKGISHSKSHHNISPIRINISILHKWF